MKVKKVIEIIRAEGWYLARTKGSHRQFKHPIKKGLVTIAGSLADDMAKGTLNNILKQSQVSKELSK